MLHEIDIKSTDRVVFIHLPKTAGVTFSAIISPLLSGLPRCPAILSEDFVQIPYDELIQYRLFMGHFPYRLMEMVFPDGFLPLTFLREPVDRTISHYRYLIRQETMGGPTWGDFELRLIKKMTFEEFLTNTDLHIALDIINLQTRYLGGGIPAQNPPARGSDGDARPSIAEKLTKISNVLNVEVPSVQGRSYSDARHLEVAKRRLEEATFFGITERFQDSLFLVSFIFGWPPALDSLRLNRAPTSDRSKEFDGKIISLIQDKIGLDAELYRFGQEVFEQRFNEMTRLLLQRYGDKTHKDLRLPLPADLLFTLLQKHYEARRNHRSQALLSDMGPSYVYHPASFVEGAFGWYPVETSAKHGPMSWSGPGVQSGFDLPCPPGRNLQISFRILMALQSDILNALTFTANNIPIVLTRTIDPDGASIFTGHIPSQAISGPFLSLIFSVPRTISPCVVDPNNKDERSLGILLNWIKLKALDSQEAIA